MKEFKRKSIEDGDLWNGLSKTLFVLLLLILIFFSFKIKAKKPYNLEELSLVWLEDAKTLDPIKAKDPQSIELIVNVYDRLLQYGLKNQGNTLSIDPQKFVPSLAESFQVDEGGKLYIFRLRKGVKFHDGSPLTSEDVKFSLDRLSSNDPNFGNMIERIETIGAYAIRVVLKSPNSLFLHYVCSYKASIVKSGFSEEINSGSGPYKIIEWIKGKKIVLEAVKNHYLDPRFSKIVISIVESAKILEAMLLTGEATGPSKIPLEDLEVMRKSKNLKTIEVQTFDVVLMVLNCNKNPFNNSKVRQALAWAVPSDKIKEVVFRDIGTHARSVVPEGLPEHNYTLWKYSYNITDARKMLLQSKITLKPVISITVPSGDPKQIEIGSILQIATNSIGMKLIISQEEESKYNELLGKGEFQIVLMWKRVIFPDSAEVLREIFLNESIQYSFYSNSKLNELILEAFKLSGPSRNRVLSEIQALLAEEVPVIPILYPKDILLANKAIEGYVYYPDGALRYWELFQSTKTDKVRG